MTWRAGCPKLTPKPIVTSRLLAPQRTVQLTRSTAKKGPTVALNSVGTQLRPDQQDAEPRTGKQLIHWTLARLDTTRTDARWLIVAASLAVTAGLAAASGNPVAPVAVLGIIGGAMLLSRPAPLLFLTVVYSLLISGVLWYFAGLDKTDYLIFVLCSAFWPATLICALGSRENSPPNPGMPAYFWLLAGYAAITLGSSLIQFESSIQLLIGLKSYFVCAGLMVALMLIPWPRNVIKKVALAVFVIGLIQLPFALFQFLVVRRLRIAHGGFGGGDNEIEASDSVVGTMGGFMMTFGLDSLLAVLQVALLAGLLVSYLNRSVSVRAAVPAAIVLATPLVLTENKLIFLAIPLAFFVVAGSRIRQNPSTFLAGAIAVAISIAVGIWGYYQVHWSNQYPDFGTALEKSAEYSFKPSTGRDRRQEGKMSRVEALQYWWDSQSREQVETTLFGHGLSASKRDSGFFRSQLVARHGDLGLDKSLLTALLWDTGVVGTALFIAVLASAFRVAGRTAKSAALDPAEQAIVKALQVATVMFVLGMPLKLDLIAYGQGSFSLFFTLGLIGYYARRVR